VIDTAALPLSSVTWESAVRIVRSIYPPIDLFEDISDPADWPLLISAEQKTNPRLMEQFGNLDLVPEGRRVGGTGATYLMAPFCHVSHDRKSRFSDGSFGVLYVGNSFEVALLETIYHHERFMARTREAAGWTSQFREIVLNIDARLHDLRKPDADQLQALDPDNYAVSQVLAAQLRAASSDGVVYPSARHKGGECVGLFYPDLATDAVQGRHLDYHWDGTRVDLYRNPSNGHVFRIVPDLEA
jgi:RES domain